MAEHVEMGEELQLPLPSIPLAGCELDTTNDDNLDDKNNTVTDTPMTPLHQQLHDERHALLAKIVELSEALDDEREIRAELEAAKQALNDEVEELSRSLFEEAGSMVAKEAKARAAIEAARKKLERDLVDTREQLENQTSQLEELKARIQSMSISALDIGDDNVLDPKDNATANQPLDLSLHNVRSYCEVLFPEQKFSSRRRLQHQPKLWKALLDDIVHGHGYNEFGDFVEKLLQAKSSSSSNNHHQYTSHTYFKAVFEREAEAALYFSCKSSSFPNRVIAAMLANECLIERVKQTVDDAMPLNSPDSGASLLAKLTNSVTSLPDTLANLTATAAASESSTKSLQPSPTASPSRPRQSNTKCSLCNRVILPPETKWRMKLSPKETQWRVMDEGCRDRLVAVGDFCAFIRHIRAGLHCSRPLLDLYVEQLHHRRNIFYARTLSLPLFLVSDFEQFRRRMRVRRHVAPDMSSEGSDSCSSILYDNQTKD